MLFLIGSPRRTAGLVTYHRSLNEGAVVQAYALRNFLERELGMRAILADYDPPNRRIFQRSPAWNVPHKDLIAAFSRSLPRSDTGPGVRAARNWLNEECALAVFGSDEIWRFPKANLPSVNTVRAPNLFFGKGVIVPRAAYAVSIGESDARTLTKGCKRDIASELEKFAVIGARDEKTLNFVKDLLPSANATIVPDPTFAADLPLQGRDWFRGRLETLGIATTEKVAVLVPAFRNRIGRGPREELERAGYRVVSTYDDGDTLSLEPLRLSPLEWFSAIAAADFVATQRMHGLAAALIGNVPCMVLGDRQKNGHLREAFGLPAGTATEIERQWDGDRVERTKTAFREVHRAFVADLRRAAGLPA